MSSSRAEPAAREVVEVDLATGTLLTPLPFDVPLVIKGSHGKGLPKETICVVVKYDLNGQPVQEIWRPLRGVEVDAFYVPIKPLLPNVDYRFDMTIVRRVSDDDSKRAVEVFKRTLTEAVLKIGPATAPPAAPAPAVDKLGAKVLADALNLLRTKVLRSAEVGASSSEPVSDPCDGSALSPQIPDTLDARTVEVATAAREAANAVQSFTSQAGQAATDLQQVVGVANAAAADPNFTQDKDAKDRLGSILSLSVRTDLVARGEASLQKNGVIAIPYLKAVSNRADSASITSRITALETSIKTLSDLASDIRASTRAAGNVRGGIARVENAMASLSSVATQLNYLASSIKARDEGIAKVAEEADEVVSDRFVLSTPKKGAYKANAATYVSLDLGLAWMPAFDEKSVAPYVGANVYLRPVNKEAYLPVEPIFGENKKRGTRSVVRELGRRFSLLLGTTVTSIAQKGRREGLFGNVGLLVGAGFRATSYIRAGAGAILFRAQDPNPLVHDADVAASYYLSVSFDIDVVEIFGGVSKAIFAL